MADTHRMRAVAQRTRPAPEAALNQAVHSVIEGFVDPSITWSERNERRKEAHRAIDTYYAEKAAKR